MSTKKNTSDDDDATVAAAALLQTPPTLVIACSDARWALSPLFRHLMTPLPPLAAVEPRTLNRPTSKTLIRAAKVAQRATVVHPS